MAVPAQLHRQLTSGNLTTIRTRETDADTAMDDVRAAIDMVHLAKDTPNWESLNARAMFNISAWATCAVGEVSHMRLNRAKLSLGMAGDGYSWASGEAERIYGEWTKWQKTAVKGSFAWFVTLVNTVDALETVKRRYGRRLRQARDYFEFELTKDQQAWFENGLARTLVDDLERGTLPGPVIPDTLAAGDDDHGWTPQGLGYDPDSGYLLQTSYNSKGEAVLSVIDPDTGEVVNTVNLGAAGGMAPDHVGGVSVDPETGTVYVNSSTGGGENGDEPMVYEYDRDDIIGEHAQGPGSTVGVSAQPLDIPNGAYSTFHDGKMYVGTFEKEGNGTLSVYEKQFSPGSGKVSWVRVEGPYDTPPKTQGVAIRDGKIYFSTSYKRHNDTTGVSDDEYNPGKVIAHDLSDTDNWADEGSGEVTIMPNMIEGIAAVPGDGIWGTYESGSLSYSDDKDADGKDTGDDETLWPSVFFSRTPYAGSELHSEYESMNKAGQHLKDAQAAFDACETEIHALGLPATSLGDVPQAAPYASGLVKFFDQTARWLDKGKFASGVTARGVIESAIEYETTDQLNMVESAVLQARLGGIVSKDWTR